MSQRTMEQAGALAPEIEGAAREAFAAYPDLAMTLLRTALGYAAVSADDPKPDWWRFAHGLAVELPGSRRVPSYVDPRTNRKCGPTEFVRIVTFYVRVPPRGGIEFEVDCFEGPRWAGEGVMPERVPDKPEGTPFVLVRQP